jgi:hypothetical protein
MKYASPAVTYHSEDMANVKVFFKIGQTSRSRSQGQKLCYQHKGLVIRNAYELGQLYHLSFQRYGQH